MDGRDRPVGEPLLVLERRDNGDGTTAATDLEFWFVWYEDDGTYEARYDVPPDFPRGRTASGFGVPSTIWRPTRSKSVHRRPFGSGASVSSTTERQRPWYSWHRTPRPIPTGTSGLGPSGPMAAR